MAESNNPSLTPEKRLLDLIEEPDSLKKETTVRKETQRPKTFWTALGLQKKWTDLKGRSEVFFASQKKTFGIKTINQVLLVVVSVIVIVLMVSVVVDWAGMGKDFTKSIQIPDSKMLEVEIPQEGIPEDLAAEQWDLGKMFMPYAKRREEADKLQQEQSTRLAELIKKLKLTGISFDPADAAMASCMIEDMEKGITTFLREGDPVGGLTVVKIHEDHVVLGQKNETIEMR